MKKSRSLLGIEQLEPGEISRLLGLARRMHATRPRPLLRNRRIALLFYEPSTRTRVSFEFAAKALGAITTLVQATASSIEKGESLVDTGLTLRATGADAIVVRHPSSGAPHLLARHLGIPVINAGDGMHEHPTQALLDAYTILRHKRQLRNLRVAIVGDIQHSRVARSNIHLLSKSGAQVVLCGPPELLPEVAASLGPGVRVTRHVEEALRGADVIMVLRVQKERLAGLQLHMNEYIDGYQVTPERLLLARRDAILMHPGPMIRGIELAGDLADAPASVITEQVANGVSVRMAVLLTALGAAR
ncbi:MAG TPA: aspartate carbamoyltransferase catalytic subunit [Terriglobales bacterium]|jgi:aspartate carbamoyltransferase catalytic subunit|nr:aspartate carbamoyltransferase catalytic subunit [Terriglobales bacterium]